MKVQGTTPEQTLRGFHIHFSLQERLYLPNFYSFARFLSALIEYGLMLQYEERRYKKRNGPRHEGTLGKHCSTSAATMVQYLTVSIII